MKFDAKMGYRVLKGSFDKGVSRSSLPLCLQLLNNLFCPLSGSRCCIAIYKWCS